MDQTEKRMCMIAAFIVGLFVFLVALFSSGCDGHEGQVMQKAFTNIKGEFINPTVVCR